MTKINIEECELVECQNLVDYDELIGKIITEANFIFDKGMIECVRGIKFKTSDGCLYELRGTSNSFMGQSGTIGKIFNIINSSIQYVGGMINEDDSRYYNVLIVTSKGWFDTEWVNCNEKVGSFFVPLFRTTNFKRDISDLTTANENIIFFKQIEPPTGKIYKIWHPCENVEEEND